MSKTIVDQVALLLLGMVFFLNLFSVPNIGQQSGLISTYNMAVYVGVGLFIGWSIYRSVLLRQVVFSPFQWLLLFCIALPLVVGALQAHDWMEYRYQAGAILVGLMFVFAMMQYRWQAYYWFWLFYSLAVLGLIQGLIALDQRFDNFSVLYTLTGYFPFIFKSAYVGTLQQKNMFASFMAFTVVLSLFLLYQPRFQVLRLWQRLPLFALAFLGVFLVVNSGSRAGLLALIAGVGILLWGLRHQFSVYKRALSLWMGAALVGLLLNLFVPVVGNSVNDKFASVIVGSDIRWFLYESGWALFLENLWLGVGIGNYPAAFQEFVLSHHLWLDARIANYDIRQITHPHNELLYWLIQVGLIGMLPVLLGLVALLANWFKQGVERFYILLGVSAPLVMQALVSYPFELSATHYFLMLLLLVYGVQSKQRVIEFELSKLVQFFMFVVLIVVVLGVLRYGYQSASAAFETYYFKNRLFFYREYPEQEQVGYFKNASQIELYRELVLANMQNLFKNAVRDNNVYDLKQYLLWYRQQSDLPVEFADYAVLAEQRLQGY